MAGPPAQYVLFKKQRPVPESAIWSSHDEMRARRYGARLAEPLRLVARLSPLDHDVEYFGALFAPPGSLTKEQREPVSLCWGASRHATFSVTAVTNNVQGAVPDTLVVGGAVAGAGAGRR